MNSQIAQSIQTESIPFGEANIPISENSKFKLPVNKIKKLSCPNSKHNSDLI